MATKRRPILVGIRGPSSLALHSPNTPGSQSPDGYEDEGEEQAERIVHWVEIETVAEFVSNGTSTPDGTEQAIAHTSYLLIQRPDRVAVLGLYISLHRFSLILIDATRVYYTTLSWNDEPARKLPFRFSTTSMTSMIDPTVTRRKPYFYNHE